MSGAPFRLTRVGRTFYEQTVPELVRQLTRLGDLLEQLVDRMPAGCSGEVADCGPGRGGQRAPTDSDTRASTRGATRTAGGGEEPR